MKAALVLLLPPGELSRKLEGVKARARPRYARERPTARWCLESE
jgi:hypothetical protein